jgi:hypothetical protein
MTLRPILREEAAVCVLAEPDPVPVEGNASASGDDAFDHEVDHNILSRLQQGDVWAWAAVTVSVTWNGFEGRSSLGCCSYADEDDFRQPDGYFDNMVEEALAELNQILDDTYNKLKTRTVS